MINDLNGCRIDLSAELPAIVISHMDRKGMIHQITSVLLDEDMNVGTLKLTRNTKGEHALSIIEVDESVDDKILERLRRIPDVLMYRQYRYNFRQEGLRLLDTYA